MQSQSMISFLIQKSENTSDMVTKLTKLSPILNYKGIGLISCEYYFIVCKLLTFDLYLFFFNIFHAVQKLYVFLADLYTLVDTVS